MTGFLAVTILIALANIWLVRKMVISDGSSEGSEIFTVIILLLGFLPIINTIIFMVILAVFLYERMEEMTERARLSQWIDKMLFVKKGKK